MSDVLDQLNDILDEDEEETTTASSSAQAKPESDDEDKEKAKRLKELATNGTELDLLELDEAIYDNGPTRAEVEAFKLKYPTSKLLCLILADGYGVLYRTLTRREWRATQKLIEKVTDSDRREEIVFSKIVLHPDCSDHEVIGGLQAGVVPSVMNEFYLHSGFAPIVQSLQL